MMQKYFESITDKSQAWKTKHSLLEVVIMTICAVIADCEAWYQIEEYCAEKEKWFKEKLGLSLPNGVPSHDTFERIFAMIDSKELEKCFVSWVGEVSRLTEGEIVSIDGKTLCASKSDDKKAIHMVSAWANSNKVVLGQVRTDEKSNEITAIPELLNLRRLRAALLQSMQWAAKRTFPRRLLRKKPTTFFL